MSDSERDRSAGVELAQQLAEARVLANGFEVAILAHETEVAVAQLHCPPQRGKREVRLLQERVGAGEVVVSQRVFRAELNDAAVNQQPFGIALLLGEVFGMSP